ncbi:MAG: hypothetical protein Q8867_05120 [Bacteroidota bacterium]|nr:hypothetical protein [Bacteroidota bacterium]
MRKILKKVWILALFAQIACTHHAAPVASSSQEKSNAMLPSAPCIVYKTNGDYSNLVPVTLSEDRSKIVSYPDRLDISMRGSAVYPTQLINGYLLDNRGITPYVAFLKTTYSDYGKADEVPKASQLMKDIFVKEPLVEMYQCGRRSDYSDIKNELNNLIRSGHLSDCVRLK